LSQPTWDAQWAAARFGKTIPHMLVVRVDTLHLLAANPEYGDPLYDHPVMADLRQQICMLTMDAIHQRDAAAFRELADYLENPRSGYEDLLRARLAWLKGQMQNGPQPPDGGAWQISIPELRKDLLRVGWQGEDSQLRREAKAMGIPTCPADR